MIRPLLLSSIAALAITAGAAAASVPETPSLKPDRVYVSKVTDSKNVEVLERAFRAADASQWGLLSSLQRQATDSTVRDLIMWKRASDGVPGMGFEEVSSALDSLQGWPSRYRIQKRAEELISESTLGDKDIIDWFDVHPARTGPGKVALADAWRRIGETDKAAAIIREAWRTNSMPRSMQNAVLGKYGYALTQADHEARIDFLLWTNQRSAANALKSKVSPGWQRLTEARIALAARGKGVNSKIEAVPAALKDHPGLRYERARWRRKSGNQSGATELLKQIDGTAVPPAGRGKLWKERRIAVRSELKEGTRLTAYKLSAPHGMSEGADFAEAEWTAGWIALRMTDDAEAAAKHFQSMEKGVSTPISLARATYWNGRALDVLGRNEEALAAYRDAAKYKFTYYGQLASERLGDRSLNLGPPIQPTDAQLAEFEGKTMVRALRLLGETGNTRTFRRFAYHLDDELSTAADYTQLAAIAQQYGVQEVGVRGAKAGLAKGVVSPSAAYPIVEYQLQKEPRVERPLMLALSRQESEMNPKAVSHAGARGLMQFMPATAKREARLNGLPYRQSWLTDDPGYNMTLGGAHLDNLLGQFNGSYIMTAAAYNAGASRPKRWVTEYGDPRSSDPNAIDPVDWVEFIPFSETRNYVQRVLENTQVYRYRMTGEDTDIRLTEDLERGQF